jgi:hypothetical protein
VRPPRRQASPRPKNRQEVFSCLLEGLGGTDGGGAVTGMSGTNGYISWTLLALVLRAAKANLLLSASDLAQEF